ncbi:hypothetical protein [Candidatus Liberibacter solanacearum]|uniref:DUF3035 domain-containing protein n=1 Tax=Candidatus Liberibacter solanacearum TaxID=556287 RepID=A0A1V2N791_9HYPH|nr:hypothetical protein [Candidatus Liberibacter solanacearum]ONI58775.1 hypothetical protein AYO25_04185 [Candidatus Liberibacter solanacearum]
MISKKFALTSILLSSSVLLNGCDLLESESRNTTIPATNTSSSKSTEEPKTPKDSLDFSMLLKLSPQDSTNILKMHSRKELVDFVGHNNDNFFQPEHHFYSARRNYEANPEDKNAQKAKDEAEAYYNKVRNLEIIIQSVTNYRETVYGEKNPY